MEFISSECLWKAFHPRKQMASSNFRNVCFNICWHPAWSARFKILKHFLVCSFCDFVNALQLLLLITASSYIFFASDITVWYLWQWFSYWLLETSSNDDSWWRLVLPSMPTCNITTPIIPFIFLVIVIGLQLNEKAFSYCELFFKLQLDANKSTQRILKYLAITCLCVAYGYMGYEYSAMSII